MATSQKPAAKPAPGVRYLKINSMGGKPYTTRVRLLKDREHGHLFPGEVVEIPAGQWDDAWDEGLELGLLAEVPKPKGEVRPLRWPDLFTAQRMDPRRKAQSDMQIKASEGKLQAAIKNRQQITMGGSKLRGSTKETT